MEPEEIIFWFCVMLNIGLAGSLTAYFWHKVKIQGITEARAKVIYSWLCLASGVFSGVVVFLSIITLLNVSLGHRGVILITAPLFNLLLAGVLIIVGRIIIGWVPIKW
jgi:drug/metabolite transporter (DMT)-like permease